MGGGSYDLRVRYRRGMNTSRYEPGEVSHINEVQRADGICNLAHSREVDDSRISASASYDQLWVFPLRQLCQIVVINGLVFPGNAVGNNAVRLTGEIKVMAVG